MLAYLKRKIRKYIAKRKFQEYEHKIVDFDLGAYGNIRYAQWMNPLERPKSFPLSKIEFFKKFLKEGDWAIDIGAHTGDTPIPIGLAVGRTGTVLALEPNPHIFKILEVNAKLNADKINIVPLPFAATKTDGDFFYSSSEASFNNGGIATEQTNRHGKFTLQTKVQGVNLQAYVEKNYPTHLQKIKFIKIDTEGYDFEVLKSIDGLIQKLTPTLVFECFGKLTSEDRTELFNLVSRKGYSLYYFEDFDSNTKLIKLSAPDMMKWKHFDVLAKMD